MDRNEEIKKISELLYNEYISNGWKNVSTEGCERQAINYIDVRDLVKKLTLTDLSHQMELLIDFAEKVYRRIYFTWDKKTSEKVVDEYIKGNL